MAYVTEDGSIIDSVGKVFIHGRWPFKHGHDGSVRISRTALSDKTSRLRPRHVVSKPGQTHEPELQTGTTIGL
jgi:hypothetical protein